MKKLAPILAALVLSILIIWVLFATGMLKITNEQGKKKIDFSGMKKTVTTTESFTYAQRMKKGDEYVKSGMTSLAFNEYIAANQIQPENPEPYLKIGRLLFEKQDYARAQDIFQQLLTRDAEHLEANIYYVRSFMMLRKPEKAREILNTITGENQQKHYYGGVLATYFGEYDNAKKSLNAAVSLNTDPELSEKAKKILSAFEEYNTNQGSQEIFLKTLLAKNFNQVGEYAMSIPLLFNVVKEKKDYRDAWILLGYAYLNMSDTKNAIDALEEAKKLDGNKSETLFFLGLAYHANNQKELAAQLIEQAVQKGFEPKIQAQQKLAEIYLELKEYEKSAKKYESVLAINDTSIDYYVRPMWIYIDELNQPGQALALAQKAITKYPENAMAHNLMGWAYFAAEDYQKSRDALAKSLELDPGLSAAYLNLGKLYERLAQLDTAKEYYQTAVKLGQGTSVGETATELYNRVTVSSGQANIFNTTTATPPSQKMPTFTLPPLTTTP